MSRAPLSLRVYRWLLIVYPARFRQEAAEELVETFRQQRADAARRGWYGLVKLWATIAVDLASSSGSVWWQAGKDSWRGRRATGALGDEGRGGGEAMGNLLRDVRHALRALARSPGFTAVAVLILALGIGANTTIFAVVDSVYFDAPPHIVEPERLVRVYRATETTQNGSLAYPDYAHYAENNEVFDGLAAWDPDGVALTIGGGDAPEPGRGTFVSHNYFDVLGVRPAAGRWFRPEEDVTPGTHHVAVVSHGLWQRAFGSDADVVGRDILLNGTSFSVVGVAPEGFRGPSPLESPPDVWVPMHAQPTLAPTEELFTLRRIPGNTWVWLRSIGRLREGVTLEVAQEHMSGLALYLEESFAEWNAGWGVRLYDNYRFHPPSGTSLGTMTRLLFVVVAAVLLIASANIAILLLARGSSRARDVAVRVAVGAGRGRIIRASLTESLVLALLGSAAGMLVAFGAADVVAGVLPTNFSVSFEPDASVLAFAVGLGTVTALVFGLIPALQASRVDVSGTIKGAVGGRAGSKARGVLVVTQVGVSLMLTVAAVLLARSLATASSVPLGFDVENRTLVWANLRNHGYSDEEGRLFYQEALDRIRALPGVESASTLRVTPFAGVWSTSVLPPDAAPGDPTVDLDLNAVSPDFFETMGISVVAGRAFGRADDENGPPVAVVSATTARRLWEGRNPVGQVIRDDEGEVRWEVVGVVEDARYYELGSAPESYAYLPVQQQYNAAQTYVVRGDVSTRVLREALLEIDPNLAVSNERTMREVVDREVGRYRTAATLVGGFGLLALALAVVGLYGVLSYSVAQSTRTIGIRVALGASTARVRRGVLRHGMRLTGVGIVLGLMGAFVGGRVLSGYLYGISARDPVTMAGAPLLLAAVATAACLVPAWRAARVDPMEALRSE